MFSWLLAVVTLLCLSIFAGTQTSINIGEESLTVLTLKERRFRTGNDVSVLREFLIGRAQKMYSRTGKGEPSGTVSGTSYYGGKLCHYDRNGLVGCSKVISDTRQAPGEFSQQAISAVQNCGMKAKTSMMTPNKQKLANEVPAPAVKTSTQKMKPQQKIYSASSPQYKIISNGHPVISNTKSSSSKIIDNEFKRPIVGEAKTKAYKIMASRASVAKKSPGGSRHSPDITGHHYAAAKSTTLKIQGEGVPLLIPGNGVDRPVVLQVSNETKKRILSEHPEYSSYFVRAQNPSFYHSQNRYGVPGTTGLAQNSQNKGTALKFRSNEAWAMVKPRVVKEDPSPEKLVKRYNRPGGRSESVNTGGESKASRVE